MDRQSSLSRSNGIALVGKPAYVLPNREAGEDYGQYEGFDIHESSPRLEDENTANYQVTRGV